MSTDYKQQHISNDFYLSMAIRQTDITFSNRTKKNIVSIIIGLKRNRIIKSISTIRHVLGWLDMNSEHKTPYYIPPNIHQSHKGNAWKHCYQNCPTGRKWKFSKCNCSDTMPQSSHRCRQFYFVYDTSCWAFSFSVFVVFCGWAKKCMTFIE